MYIAKQSKNSSSQQSPKKRFSYRIKKTPNLLPSMLLASLLGTYLDLFFIGKGIYAFPLRPMSTVFSINIAFTLIALPLMIGVFLTICIKVNTWNKAGVIILVSLLFSVIEKQAEVFGFFVHHDSWKHIYSFFGSILFFTFIYFFYSWSKQG